MRKLRDKALQHKLERALINLMGGKTTMTADERKEMRDNINLATKFLAVKNKLGGEEYGSGFTNGEAKEEKDDERLNDE